MEWLQILATIAGSVLASSGLWAFLSSWMDKKRSAKDVRTQMLIGLGHDRIMSLGVQYIERKYITYDEYENLNDYLYKPYEAMGGNGSAKRVMEEVRKLELRNTPLPQARSSEN